jgi:hypothetical protein
LACADRELTGHRWHPSHTSEQHDYIGRRRVLFCTERDAHLGELTAQRLPPRPPGHPARQGHDTHVRRVQLPVGIHSDGGAERHGQPQDATSVITVGYSSGPAPREGERRNKGAGREESR